MRVVHYQTEPLTESSLKAAAVPKQVRNVPTRAASRCALDRHAVHESWDYSWSNLDFCHAAGERVAPLLRHVPPGPQPDLFPSTTKPSRRDGSSEASTIGTASVARAPPRLFFLGQVQHSRWGNRSICWQALERELPPSTLQEHYGSWGSIHQVLNAIGSSSIKLNLHRWCGNGSSIRTAFEAFRAAQLLSHGAVVISERSFAADEAMYRGMVHFAELRELPALFHRLASLTLQQRQRMGADARETFLSRFRPEATFERAGIYAMLDLWLDRGVTLGEPADELPVKDRRVLGQVD